MDVCFDPQLAHTLPAPRMKRPRIAQAVPLNRANNIDELVGNLIRIQRMALGMTAEELGALIGASLSQIDRYERGVIRISVSRLYQIAVALGQPVESLFGNVPVPHHSQGPSDPLVREI